MYVPIASIKDRPIINDKAETGQGTRRKCTYFTRDRHTYMHSRHDEKTAFVRTSKSRKKSIDLSIHPEQHRNEGTWSELTKSPGFSPSHLVRIVYIVYATAKRCSLAFAIKVHTTYVHRTHQQQRTSKTQEHMKHYKLGGGPVVPPQREYRGWKKLRANHAVVLLLVPPAHANVHQGTQVTVHHAANNKPWKGKAGFGAFYCIRQGTQTHTQQGLAPIA